MASTLTICAMTVLLATSASTVLAPVSPRADFVILPGSAVPRMLSQCSRGTPKSGEGTWQPTIADVVTLEKALPAALSKARTGEGLDWANVTDKWDRQYVGIVRDGRHMIYGNFFPYKEIVVAEGRFDWRKQPFEVCDGGDAFFGVEYDVEANAFTHIAFNGYP